MSVEKTQQIQPSTGAIIGGVLAGSTVNGLVKLPVKRAAGSVMKNMQKISGGLNSDEFKIVRQAIEDTIKNTGLDKKGVSILKATSENSDQIAEALKYEFNNNILTKRLPKAIKEFLVYLQGSQCSRAENAFYTFKAKKLLLPEKLSLAGFHEIGHAANQNLSKAAKMLQKCRPLMLLATPIALIALLKTQKPQEPESTTGKVTTFIKENAGKLTFAAFLPTLAEEALATFKGNGYARKLLNPELASKAAKTNALGFVSYALLALGASLGIYLGVKLKDAITDNSIKKRADKL